MLFYTRHLIAAFVKEGVLFPFLIAVLVVLSLSLFIAQSMIVEKQQFFLVFFSSSARLLCVFFTLLMTSIFIRRSFENKDPEFVLSAPVSRIEFLLSHHLAFSILATVLVIATGLIALVFYSVLPLTGFVVWLITFWFELMIVTQVAVFFALFLNNAVFSILIGAGFYILARLIGTLMLLTDMSGPLSALTKMIMEGIGRVIPRLDLMAQTDWLLYDVNITLETLFLILIQGVVFMMLVIMAAFLDLRRKEF